MPYRTTPLVNDQVYHIYNRGNEKRQIFGDRRDFIRLHETLRYYQIAGFKPKFSNSTLEIFSKLDPSKKIVEILAYCFMPNHFHLLLRQVTEGGISEFVSKFSNSYTKYYNTKYKRIGALFQGQFKSVLVESDEQLVHVSRYIHLNPFVGFLVKELTEYDWSSYPQYLNLKNGIANKDFVMQFFESPKSYQAFVTDQASYAQDLDIIKHKLLDSEE